MKRKKIQKLITTVLTVAFIANNMSTLAFGLTNAESGKSYKELVQALQDQINNQGEESDNIISKDVDTSTSDMVSIIVEFVSEPLAESKTSTYSLFENKVDRDHRVFEKFLSNLPSTFSSQDQSPSIKYSYKNVFNGVALTIKGTDISSLSKSGVVKYIYKDAEVTVDPPVDVTETSDNEIAPLMMDSLPTLGIDALHNENINGTGIKVGVLDTGIDYNHPDLASVYKGYKGEAGSKDQNQDTTLGWDYISNDADPMETTYKDWLSSGKPEFNSNGSYYTSHGTHVAGTIAGTGENQDTEYPVLGVAPKVELYGYRVLGPYGSGATAGIIAAIEKSVYDGMDVINMSLGSSGDYGPYDPLVTAVNNATKAGVVTVISNGNSGPNAFTVGSPGTAQLPIAVGASTVAYDIDNYLLKIGGVEIKSALLGPSFKGSFNELLNTELEIVYCGLGYPEDFKDKDLTGKIAFVDRGILTFVDKAKNAADAGAKAVIIANNTTATEIPFLGEQVGANILAITLEDGNKLKEVQNEKLTISSLATTHVEGDEITDFSSVGPVKRTYEIRPDIAAPGYNVYSTAPEYINDKNQDEENYNIAYQRMSGTSMAAPHIAGIAALILQAHPEYTPEEVKLAIMNTSEHIHRKDGVSYSVHETGAGRVNAYEAVHEDVTFSAEYETTSGEPKETINNITGMLSYGKIAAPETGEITKTIPVTVKNNSSTKKSFKIEVEYSDSKLAKDAIANGFTLTLPSTVEVDPSESKTFNVSLAATAPLEFGIYEGYIHFTEVDDSTSTYQMPFSASIMKDGFATLKYPALSDGFAEGITAFTTSDLFNRNPMTYFGLNDISIQLQVSNEVKTISTYVVDPTSLDRIGFAGEQDTSWLPVGTDVYLEGFASNGKVRKIVNDKISHEEYPLPSGIYKLEVVATEYDGTIFSEYLPMAVINDTYSDKITYNMEDGIIEVTEDMYTKNTWYDGKDHEGIWLNANVYNDIVNKLKTEYGMDYLKQDEVNTIFANGTYRNGSTTPMGNMTKGNGDILIAGIERDDLKSGFFRVDLSYANAGKSMNKPDSFIFVDKTKSYLSLTTDTEKLTEDTTLTSTITINNAEKIVKGSFKLQTLGDVNFNDVKLTPSKELKTIAGDNLVTDVKYDVVDDGWSKYGEITVNFEITSTDKNFEGITGDMKLFDISSKVSGFNGFDEKLMDDKTFVYSTIKGVDGEFRNISNEVSDVMAGTIYKTLDNEYKNRTLIYGYTSSPWFGMSNANIYAIDPNGNKYEPTFLQLDLDYGRSHRFAFNDLPVIDGDYKVILEMPGCFDSVMNVPGGTLNEKNELVGNTFGIVSYSFTSSSMVSYPGDVNGDGAIDIVDASELAKVYTPGTEHLYSLNNPSSDENLVTDLTQDGEVNYYDMYLLLSNYLMQDLAREDSKVPEEYLDGRDIIDVLESCGYFDEVPYMDVKLNLDKEISLVGDEISLDVIPATEEVEFEYEFSMREKNDKDWTVIQERSSERSAKWTSKTAGDYEFKARVFLDEIEYVWQDNKFHSVNWADLQGIDLANDKLVEGVLNINTGDKTELKVNLNPWNARPQEFQWTSSDESIVTVHNGNITALKEGTAEITVKTADSSFSSKCTVNVSDIKVQAIELNKTSLDLKVGDSDNLTVTINPENATNKNVTWASANEKIATVKDGKVVGISAGTTIVTVTSEDGKFTVSCTVTVSEIKVESIELDKTSLDLKVGDSDTLTATIKPDNAVNKNVTWTSADKKIATVENGKVVGVKTGTTTITVTSEDGNFTASCTVTVSEVPSTKPVAKKITLDKNSAKLNVGDKITLKASVTPADADISQLVWSSSDEKVATVKDGVVTAVGSGKAKITVKSKDGKLSDTCNITVSKKDSGNKLPQTGVIAGSGLIGAAGLMTLSVSALIVIGKKKEQDN